MFFSLDVLRARKGDCLLLHFGSKEEPGLVMIDGGPSNVYLPHLKPRIEAIRKARKLARQESLIVDLLMVSHVDDDHIRGILDLTREERVALDANKPRLINVQSFWHNSFSEIIGHEPSELTEKVKQQFGEAAVSGGDMPDDLKAEVEDKHLEDNPDEDPEAEREIASSTLKVLASIEQGFRLRHDAAKLGFPPNPEFAGALIMAGSGAKAVTVGQRLKLTVVGPMQAELAALHRRHQEWLEGLAAKGKSPSDALAAYVDKSVPNLSSIVVLAEVGGKRMLLTGDARGDKVLEGLQLVGLLGRGKDSKIEVDLLKVPHHGSANNLDNDFFERIIARHYVFSGDGEHGNPEREALEMLLKARGDADYEVHLTYPVEEIDQGREEDWNKERNKQIARKQKNPQTEVRAEWSRGEHSLAALFEDNPDFAAKVRTVGGKAPHLIELLDPVTF
jgi:hypothetical protein